MLILNILLLPGGISNGIAIMMMLVLVHIFIATS